MPLDADLLGPNFVKHAQHWTKLVSSPGLQRHPRGIRIPSISGGFFRSPLGRWVVFSSCESHSFELLAVSCKFQEVVADLADHDIFPLYFPKVQGAICVQPPYVYVQTIAMLVNAWVSNGA